MPERKINDLGGRWKIKSYVVLDLETSGLPAYGKSKVTEISLGGTLRSQILNVKDKEDYLPRVLHKLSLCVYPSKMIHYEASEITGLDNAILEEIPPWDPDLCPMIISFLQRLPPPVCLIAHNGLAFDFRLLRAEIAVHNQALPDNIMCADSLHAFQALFPKMNGKRSNELGVTSLYPSPSISETKQVHTPVKVHLKVDEQTSRAVNCTEEQTKNSLHEIMQQNDIARQALRMINETTPKQEKNSYETNIPCRKRSSDDSMGVQELVTPVKHGKIRKQLFGTKEPASHKLRDLYHHIFGQEPAVSHCAESDVVALLQCVVATGAPFLDWVDNNYVPFASIRPMW